MAIKSLTVFTAIIALTAMHTGSSRAAEMGGMPMPMEKNITGAQAVSIQQAAQTAAAGAKTSGLPGAAIASNGRKTNIAGTSSGDQSVKDMLLGKDDAHAKQTQQKPDGKVRYRVAGREFQADQKVEKPKRIFNNLD